MNTKDVQAYCKLVCKQMTETCKKAQKRAKQAQKVLRKFDNAVKPKTNSRRGKPYNLKLSCKL